MLRCLPVFSLIVLCLLLLGGCGRRERAGANVTLPSKFYGSETFQKVAGAGAGPAPVQAPPRKAPAPDKAPSPDKEKGAGPEKTPGPDKPPGQDPDKN